ncbi:hypothetical protein [Inhella sp.]|uniref:hypothetical protein n=1 Tax=Inhella sp. TaxID=1921806 RepID=UPI0035AFB9B3
MKTLLLALAALAPISASAQTEEALRCRGLADDRERLACFDRWAAGLAAPAARSVAAPATPAAATPSPADFGLPSKPAAPSADRVESHFEGLFEGWKKGQVIRLANGQSWRVHEDSSAYLNLQSPRVTVRRNVFGGYLMEFEGSNKVVRVRRVE